MEIPDINALKIRCNTSEFMNYALNIMSRHIYTKKSLHAMTIFQNTQIIFMHLKMYFIHSIDLNIDGWILRLAQECLLYF